MSDKEPWKNVGGSFVWQGNGGRASVPGRCCADPKPKIVGDCGQGCCDDYQCQACGKRWRYEWPD